MTYKQIYKVGRVYINIKNVTTLSIYTGGFRSHYIQINGKEYCLGDDEEIIKEANELMERFINYDR